MSCSSKNNTFSLIFFYILIDNDCFTFWIFTLQKAISMAVRDLNLQHWPSQIEQVKQLHSQLLVRHGIMLVGPTGGGKTCVRNILQRALVLMPTIHFEEDEKHGGQVIVSLLLTCSVLIYQNFK